MTREWNMRRPKPLMLSLILLFKYSIIIELDSHKPAIKISKLRGYLIILTRARHQLKKRAFFGLSTTYFVEK